MSKILLSFDIEEFDMPFEYQREISFEEQIQISVTGTTIILDLLKKHQIKATFFSTVTFALHAKDLILRIVNEGHELASHGYYHSRFSDEDYINSKQTLEKIANTNVIGFRMARMQPVNDSLIQKAGYQYNSSINPTYLPGRYNNLHISRTYFKTDGVLQIPASVTPLIRFPLFWLSFHNLPLFLYTWLSKITLWKDDYINVYFHPWEFTDLTDFKKFNFPNYVSKNSGEAMRDRMEKFILTFKHAKFVTFKEFLHPIK